MPSLIVNLCQHNFFLHNDKIQCRQIYILASQGVLLHCYRYGPYAATFPELEENEAVTEALKLLSDGTRRWGKERTVSLIKFVSLNSVHLN